MKDGQKNPRQIDTKKETNKLTDKRRARKERSDEKGKEITFNMRRRHKTPKTI